MATFGNIVAASEVAVARRGPQDNAALAPYVEAVRALHAAGPGMAATLTGISTSDDGAELKREKSNLKAAGRSLGLNVTTATGVDRASGKADKSVLVYSIAGELDTSKETAYQRLSREAREAGLTVAAYRELRASERAAGENGTGSKRGRPRKDATATAETATATV